MGGKGVEYEVKVFIRGDGLHLPPPIWQKLSARRCVNFQVAYPDFGKPTILESRMAAEEHRAKASSTD